MADATYQPNVYHKQGGDEMIVASGGLVTVESGGILRNAGIFAAGTTTTAASNIADPSGGSTSTGGTVTTGGLDTKCRAAVVSILAALEGVHITATA